MGFPAREERLGRTATFLWQSTRHKNEALPRNIGEAEVSFLNGTACQIILRSARPLTQGRIAELAKTFVPPLRTTGLPTAKALSGGGKTYALPDGGYITAWAAEKPAVMVIRSEVFLHNKEVFDREAAKVRPPTSNH